jgi:hypothetical protein
LSKLQPRAEIMNAFGVQIRNLIILVECVKADKDADEGFCS